MLASGLHKISCKYSYFEKALSLIHLENYYKTFNIHKTIIKVKLRIDHKTNVKPRNLGRA